MVKGLGTVICHVTDLDRAKAWYSSAFGLTPYFDQPFYVGFNIGGYELGLDPDPGSGRSGASAVQGIGEGIKVAQIADAFGNVIGLLENPRVRLPGT
jgi:catechol 2,3-dioxygenase-like lactoylglutathione lyase family enzyme